MTWLPKITDEQWDAFVEGVRLFGQIRSAAVYAKMSHMSAYRRMQDDPDYAALVEEAKHAFGGSVRMRVVEAAKENPKVLLALDRLANKEDYETTRNVKVQGQIMVVSSVPLAQRLHELPVMDELPALDVPARLLDDEDDDE